MRPGAPYRTGQRVMMSSVNVMRILAPRVRLSHRRMCRVRQLQMRFAFRRLSGPEKATFFEGWPTGFEPATAGTTIRGSTVELRPPCKRGKGK
jgi:hypothetical protein